MNPGGALRALAERIRRQLVRIGMGAVVLVAFLAHAAEGEDGGNFRWSFIDQMERLAYDARLKLTMPRGQDNRIVIVDIDEKSLQREGRWPWGRDRVAEMVRRLFETYKASVVGFDVVFAEPDASSGLKVLERLSQQEFKGVDGFSQRLEQIRPTLDYDGIFASVIGRYPVVLGYFFNEGGVRGQGSRSGVLPQPVFPKGSFGNRRIEFRPASGYGGNLPIFQSRATGAGHFNPWLDPDGVVRRVPMVYDYDDAQYEALSLAVARIALHVAEIKPHFEDVPFGGSRAYTGLEALELGARAVPVDEHLQTLVPYRGPKGSFPYVSATDVIHGTADPAVLRSGVIVLVGTSAAGLQDLRSTPVEAAYPGVETHANLIAGILDGRMLQKPAYTLGAEFLMLLLSGVVLVVVLPMLSPLLATAATVAMLLAYLGINMLVWTQGQLVLPVASGLLLIVTLFTLNMSYGYFVETRGKRQLSGLFGQYVPPELVDEMSIDPGRYSLEAESREMTVMFSDVRGFTTISEGLEPRVLADLINQLLTPMTRLIHDHRGTIDKYMGDAIMAFWGAPLPDPDHARHALQAAMDMVARLPALNAEFRSRGWPAINIGVGLNTGSMNVGNMGSEFRMAYTVLGDAVNLGSRLEGLTKKYGVNVIVSESTRAAVPEYAYRELDIVRVKGKDRPVAIYEPLGLAVLLDKALQDELKLYRQALKYYRGQQWDMAELQFLNLSKSSRSPVLYSEYTARVTHFRVSPPPTDWDGVWTHESK